MTREVKNASGSAIVGRIGSGPFVRMTPASRPDVEPCQEMDDESGDGAEHELYDLRSKKKKKLQGGEKHTEGNEENPFELFLSQSPP